MPANLPRRGVVVALVALCVVLPLWLLVAPSGLGGKATYVAISGVSMEPGIHAGDLVITRSRDDYGVGDAVVYRNAELGRLVLHRIVGERGERFTLQGDNNDFLDSYRPTRDEILGEEWVRIPNAGHVVAWIREPLHAAILAAVLVGLLVVGGGTAGGHVKGRRERAATAGGHRRPTTPHGRPAVLLAAGALGLLGVALSAVSFALPVSREVALAEAYRHLGTFSYGADVPRTAVYPAGRLESGGPVFTTLVERLDVGFAYRLDAGEPVDVRGTVRLRARVSDGAGWSRTIPLRAAKAFEGADATVRGTLDLLRLERLLGRVRTLTGQPLTSYVVTIAPDVRIEGRAAGGPVEAEFRPELALRAEGGRLVVDLAEGGTVESLLAPSAPEPGTRVEPTALPLLGLASGDGRVVGLGLVALALLLAGAAVLVLPAPPPPTAHERLAARLRDGLVEASGLDDTGRPVTVLGSAEELIALADRYGRSVLHERLGESDVYALDDDGVRYRAVVAAPDQAPAVEGPDWREREVSVHLLAVPTLPRLEREAALPGAQGAREEPAGP